MTGGSHKSKAGNIPVISRADDRLYIFVCIALPHAFSLAS